MGSRMLAAALAAGIALTCGCRQDMHDQPKILPLAASAFFPDGRGSRPLVDGTVAETATGACRTSWPFSLPVR